MAGLGPSPDLSLPFIPKDEIPYPLSPTSPNGKPESPKAIEVNNPEDQEVGSVAKQVLNRQSSSQASQLSSHPENSNLEHAANNSPDVNKPLSPKDYKNLRVKILEKDEQKAEEIEGYENDESEARDNGDLPSLKSSRSLKSDRSLRSDNSDEESEDEFETPRAFNTPHLPPSQTPKDSETPKNLDQAQTHALVAAFPELPKPSNPVSVPIGQDMAAPKKEGSPDEQSQGYGVVNLFWKGVNKAANMFGFGNAPAPTNTPAPVNTPPLNVKSVLDEEDDEDNEDEARDGSPIANKISSPASPPPKASPKASNNNQLEGSVKADVKPADKPADQSEQAQPNAQSQPNAQAAAQPQEAGQSPVQPVIPSSQPQPAQPKKDVQAGSPDLLPPNNKSPSQPVSSKASSAQAPLPQVSSAQAASSQPAPGSQSANAQAAIPVASASSSKPAASSAKPSAQASAAPASSLPAANGQPAGSGQPVSASKPASAPAANAKQPASGSAAATKKSSKPIVIDTEKVLKELRDKAAKATNSNESSQEIIGDMLKKLSEFPSNKFKPAEFEVSLDTKEGKYVVEPFQMTISGKEKTCYRIQVKYSITVKHTDPTKADEVISYTRTILTNSSNPEESILIASQFIKHVKELAKYNAEMKSSLDQATNKDYLSVAMKSREFNFDFSRHANGRISKLESIKVSSSDKSKTYDYKVAAVFNKYIYDPVKNTHHEAGKDEVVPFGNVIYDTEEEAILREKGYRVSHDFNKGIFQNQDFGKKYLAEKNQEINTLLNEFKKAKKKFIKVPMASLLKKEIQFSDEFERIRQEGKILNGLDINSLSDSQIALLSQNMQDYIELSQEQQENEVGLKNFAKELIVLADLKKQGGSAGDGGRPGVTQAHLDILTRYQKYAKQKTALPKVNDQMDPGSIEDYLSIIETQKKSLLDRREEVRTELASLQKEIAEEQRSFNQYLTKLQEINNDLKIHLKELEEVESIAKKKLDPKSTTAPDEKKKITQLIKGLPKLSKIKTHISQCNETMTKIEDALKKVGAHQGKNITLKASES